MNENTIRMPAIDGLSESNWIDAVCDQYELELKSGKGSQLHAYLQLCPEQRRERLLAELLSVEWESLGVRTNPDSPEAECRSFPQWTSSVRSAWLRFRRHDPTSKQSQQGEMASDFAEQTTSRRSDLVRSDTDELLAAETVSFSGNRDQLDTASESTAKDGQRPTPPGYELLEELGRGGMGVVYKAKHLALDRVVALKMILAGGHADESDRVRFKTEAEAMARLQHPGIVQIHEVGENQGLPYFSLEYCSGGSLSDRLDGTPLPAREAASLVEKPARAMQAAHEKGVIHRDLKPANVLISEDGTPKITDFGLAKKLDECPKTATGSIMGSPPYMAPEQARAEAKDVGPACDIYSLGAILYECLTGRPPFKAATMMDTLMQVISEEPVPPRRLNPNVPSDLETICLKCLEKDPLRRYATADDLGKDLQRFLNHEPIQARPIGLAGRMTRWCRRNPLVAALTATALAMTIVVLVVLTLSNLRISQALAGEQQQQQKAKQALYESLTRQSQALWLSRTPRWREEALTALRQAAQIRSDSDLRDLAVQTLAGWDWAPIARHSLPVKANHLVKSSDGRELFVAGDSQVFRGELGKDGTLSGKMRQVWKASEETEITQLCTAPKSHAVAWSTRAGGVYVKRENKEVQEVRQPDSDVVESLVFGPGSDQLAWIQSERLVVKDFTKEASRQIDPQFYSPRALLMNNPSAKRDVTLREQVCLAADPMGEFLIGSGTRLEPTLWTPTKAGISSRILNDQLPTGSNLRLASSPDGKYLYLLCNEPRWGSDQVGGRLPPWAADPLAPKQVLEPGSSALEPPGGPGSDEEKSSPGHATSPGREGRNRPPKQYGGGRPRSGGSKEPPPVGVDRDNEELQSVGGASSGSKEPPPVVGIEKEPVQPQQVTESNRSKQKEVSRRKREPSRRPLSPLLSGPVRRAYLYQFEIERNPGVPLSEPIRIKRLDPRMVDEFHIFRIGDVTGLSVASNGEVLVAGSTGTTILLRPSPPRLEEIARVTVPNPPLRAMTFLKDPKQMLFSTGDQGLHVWERQGLDQNRLVRPGLREDSPYTPWCKVVVSNVSGQLAVANWEKMVELRDLKTGRMREELLGLRYVRDLAWSPKGTTLAMATPEDHAALQLSPFYVLTEYDLTNRTLIQKAIEEPIACVHVTPSGQTTCGLRDAGLRVLPTRAEEPATCDEPPKQPQFPNRGTPTVVQVISNATQDRWAAATSDGRVQLWKASDFEPVSTYSLNGSRQRWINAICFRPNAPEFLAATTDSRLVVVTEEGISSEEIEAEEEILCVTFDKSGQYMFCGGRDGSLSLWSYPSRKRLLRWIGHDSPTGHVGFEPEGRLLSAGLDGEIRRWNLPSIRRGVQALGIDWEDDFAFDWKAEPIASPSPLIQKRVVVLADDPRRKLGRRVGNVYLMKYRVELAVPVTKVIEVDGKTKEVTTYEKVVEEREATFDIDKPLPDLKFVPYPPEQKLSPEKAPSLRNGNFENDPSALVEWTPHSFRRQQEMCTIDSSEKKDGQVSLRISSKVQDDIHCYQKVKVKPDTQYIFSGYIKTQGVNVGEGGTYGASLAVSGGFQRSKSLIGDTEWTYVECWFQTKKETEILLGPRLGHHGSEASGTAWFDQLKLEARGFPE